MRERKLQIVIKRGKTYARTTYVGLDGKRHAIWRAGKNRTEAKKNLQSALDDLKADDGAITHAKKTFRELAEWYSKRYLIPAEYRDGRQVKGRRSYSSQIYLLRAIVAYFGGYKLRSISHGELETFKEHRLGVRTKKGLRTIASVNRELMMIRAMLRKAQKEGWLLRSPFEEHDSLIRMSDERRRERTLSYAEETRLLTACSDRTKSGYNQGVRLFLIVSGWQGLHGTVILVLIVDQEVVDSNSTSRPFHPNKREPVALSSGRLFSCLYACLHTKGVL